MGKRKKINCIFCLARPSAEGEHVFPRAWYPSTTPTTAQRVKVPVCEICADEFEVAERKFSLPLLLEMDPTNPNVAGVVDNLRRSWQFDKAPSLKESVFRMDRLKSIMRQIEYEVRSPDDLAPWRFEVPRRTPAGLHIMASPTLHIEHAAVAKICEKFVRGFHYHEVRVPLPVDTPILFQWAKDFDPLLRAGFSQIPLNNNLAPGLRYRVLREGDCSFWVFYLWGQVEFTAFAGKLPPEPSEEPTEVNSK